MSTSAEVTEPASRSRTATLGTVAAVVSLVAAIVFPFAPVAREEVTYSWRGDVPGAQSTAIPMLPYQPVSTTATVSCAAAAGVRGAVLSTAPPVTEPGAEPLGGLLVASDGAPAPTVTVTSATTTLRPVRLPAGPCLLTLTSTHDATELVLATGPGPTTVVDRVPGDVRPAVAGAFTPRPAPPDGLTLAAVGDTRFQTSISAAKIAVGAVAALAAVVVLVVLARLDRRRRGPPPARRPFRRAHPSRGRLGYLVDAAVVAGLAVWQVVGPLGVDDGYIAGIVRSRFADGQVGTVFRWLNSPETPFGWFYDVLAGIAAADPAPFWLRLPSTLLGVVAWWLLTRAVLPRLRLPASPWFTVVAGVVFLAWWLPFDLGVRPEPWVVVGWAAVLVALERALARRALLPAVVALLVAGFTLAVTPTGLVAFTPFLAAAVPLSRLVRARRADAGLPLLALGAAAALGVTLLLVYNDQTWASALDSVDIRRLIGGDRPWSDEYVRYASLLTVGDVEGSLGRRAPVLLLLLALGALALPVVRDGLRGIARGPARRMITGTVASLVVLALTPTKWTHHFGAFAVVGTAVTLVALHAWLVAPARDRDADRATPRRATIALAVTAGVAGLVLSGYNQWPWVSSYALAWTDAAPTVAGVRLADLVLLLGVVASLAAAAVALRRRLASGHVRVLRGHDPEEHAHARSTDRRLLLASPVLVLAVVGLVVAAEVLTTARTAVERRDSYTLASDSLASLTGRSCGLADQLRVERDPRAGLLPAAPAPPGSDAAGTPPGAVAALSAAGTALPGWTGPGATGGWSALPARPTGAGDDAPLVLTVAGPVLTPGRLALEVADPATGTVSRMPLDEGASQFSTSASVAAPEARDLRVDRGELPDRGAVRVVTAADAPADQAVSAPRVPRTVPWLQVVPPGVAAAVDWPAAFLFPCTPVAALRDGLAALPAWRISVDARTEQASGYISYTASQGGPWAATRTLVREQRLPVYLPGAPMTDVASLERWVPVVPLGPGPRVERRRVTEWGTASPGPLTVGRG